MRVSGQGHAPAALYSRKKDPRLDRRLGGPQSCSEHKRLEEKFFASARDRTPLIQSVVRHYTDRYPNSRYSLKVKMFRK
jgi:hypothetical protein